jgi:hypothetical protein
VREIYGEGGSEVSPASNIDVVHFPGDRTVLLARTPTELSVGYVILPRNAGLVLYFGVDTDPRVSDLSAIVAKLVPNKDSALDLAMAVVMSWVSEKGAGEAKLTGFVKDAKPNESPFNDLPSGGSFTKAEEMRKAAALSRIQESGIAVPLAPLVSRIMNSL